MERNSRKVPNVFVCPGLRASHCLALAGLELLLPQLPEPLELLPDVYCQPWLYTVNFYSFTSVSQWLSEALCYWDPQAVAEGASASYPGHLLFFPSPWYQHLLLLRMSFCFFLVLRSEVGTGEEELLLMTLLYPEPDSGVLLCWAWMWVEGCPVEMRQHALAFTTPLSCLTADALILRGLLLRMGPAFQLLIQICH